MNQMQHSHSQSGTQCMFSPIGLPLFSNWSSVWITQDKKVFLCLAMGWGKRYEHLRLVLFPQWDVISWNYPYLPSSIPTRVLLSHLFILLHGLLGNLISFCTCIPQGFPFFYNTMGLRDISCTSWLLLSLITILPT